MRNKPIDRNRKSYEYREADTSILAMGAALDMRIVAEGVETVEQMNWLLRHGCHIGQGYFFSPPVARDAVHETIRGIELQLVRTAVSVHAIPTRVRSDRYPVAKAFESALRGVFAAPFSARTRWPWPARRILPAP